MANAFEILKKEKGELWNRESKNALNAIDGKGKAKYAKDDDFIYVPDDLKGFYDRYSKEEQFAQKDVFGTILGDIKRSLSLGKTPKREDFIQAAKKVQDIINVLGDATGEDRGNLDEDLFSILSQSATEALGALGKNTPGAIKAGGAAIGGKMKSVAGGFLKGMVSDVTANIPFAPELMGLAGAGIMSGVGKLTGQVSEEQKETASMLGGITTGGGAGGDDDDNGGNGGNGGNGDNGNGHGPGGGLSGVVQALNRIEDLLVTGLFGSPPYLQTISETLSDMFGAVTPDKETERETKRRKGRERLEDQRAGGRVKFGDKGWMKAMLAGLMGGAMVIGAIAAAVGALVMMVFDGIGGYFKAEEWGVSKMNALIGAVLGGTGKGLTGAMWGAAKWGGAGFAIGMAFGGIFGAVIGGAVGMMLGGIAGWFGGERIAKLLAELTTWFERKWKALRVGLGLDAYSDEDIEKIKKEETRIAAAEVKRQEDILKTHGKEEAAELFGVSPESIETAKVKHERISKATVKEIKSGVHPVFMEGASGSGLASQNVTETVTGATGSSTLGQMAGTTVFALDEFSRLLASLDPTSGNFLGTGLGTYNLVKGTNLEKFFSPHGIIGGIGTEFLSASLSNFYGSDQAAARRKLVEWNAKQAVSGEKIVLKQKQFNAENVPSLFQTDAVGLPAANAQGAQLNASAFDRVGLNGRGNMNQQPTIIDASTNTNVSNNTLIRPPSPSGQNLPGERSDFR